MTSHGCVGLRPLRRFLAQAQRAMGWWSGILHVVEPLGGTRGLSGLHAWSTVPRRNPPMKHVPRSTGGQGAQCVHYSAHPWPPRGQPRAQDPLWVPFPAPRARVLSNLPLNALFCAPFCCVPDRRFRRVLACCRRRTASAVEAWTMERRRGRSQIFSCPGRQRRAKRARPR